MKAKLCRGTLEDLPDGDMLLELPEEVIEQYPELRNENSEFNYRLILPENYEDALKVIKDAKTVGMRTPILMWLEKQ